MAVLAAAVFQTPAVEAQADEAARIRELAERLLQGPATLGPDGQTTTAQLLPGELPPDLGFEVPVPLGGRLIGSLARRAGGKLFSADVLVEAPGTPSPLLGFYRDTLTARGWTAPPQSRFGAPGGFQAGPPFGPPEFGVFCQSSEGPALMVTATARGTDRTDVRLTVQLAPPAPVPPGAIFGGPCTEPQDPFVRPAALNPLPRMTPPPGVQLLPTGASGGPSLTGSEAVALTDRSAADLATFFGDQLMEAGWEQTAAQQDGPLAWSLWDAPGDPAGQGVFMALDSPGGKQVALSLRLYTEFSPGRPGFPQPVVVPVQNIVVPNQWVGVGVSVTTAPATTGASISEADQQMAECLASSPDPALCSPPEGP